jgi:hypothetical protein
MRHAFAQICIGRHTTLYYKKHHNCRHRPDENNFDGHRRMLEQPLDQCGNLAVRARTVTKQCCEDKGSGCERVPQSCSIGCARVFLLFWSECGARFGANGTLFDDLAAKCRQANDEADAATSESEHGLSHSNYSLVADTPTPFQIDAEGKDDGVMASERRQMSEHHHQKWQRHSSKGGQLQLCPTAQCAEKPCQNSGVCSEVTVKSAGLTTAFRCKCTGGFAGTTCRASTAHVSSRIKGPPSPSPLRL